MYTEGLQSVLIAKKYSDLLLFFSGQVSFGPKRRGGRPLHAELDRRLGHGRHGRHRREDPQARPVLEKLDFCKTSLTVKLEWLEN